MRRVHFLVLLVLVFTQNSSQAITWTTLDYGIVGIDGSNLAGWAGDYGVIYNLESHSWTPINLPGPIEGISGNRLVGTYDTATGPRGFYYNGTTWDMLNFPGAELTYLTGIDGDNIIGIYRDDDGDGQGHGFLYNAPIQSYTAINLPVTLAGIGGIYDIDGSNIAGFTNGYGFVYNLDNHAYTKLNFPGVISTAVLGIDGTNVVGYYTNYSADYDFHGFLYDGMTWTPLDFPGSTYTIIEGIDGDNIVGYYAVGTGDNLVTHGFLATIPEPATLLLLSLGAAFLRRTQISN